MNETYKTLNVGASPIEWERRDYSQYDEDKLLNAISKSGWELVSVRNCNGYHKLYLRKPKP